MGSTIWVTPATWTQLFSALSISDFFTSIMWKTRCTWDSSTFKIILGTKETSFYLLPTWCNKCGTQTMSWYRKVSNMSLERLMNSSEEMISKTLKSTSTFWLMDFMRKPISGSLSLTLRIPRAMIEISLRLALRHGPIVSVETGPSYSSSSTVRWNRRLSASPVTKNPLPSKYLQTFQCPYPSRPNFC